MNWTCPACVATVGYVGDGVAEGRQDKVGERGLTGWSLLGVQPCREMRARDDGNQPEHGAAWFQGRHGHEANAELDEAGARYGVRDGSAGTAGATGTCNDVRLWRTSEV